jgi:hypothetical protein
MNNFAIESFKWKKINKKDSDYTNLSLYSPPSNSVSLTIPQSFISLISDKIITKIKQESKNCNNELIDKIKTIINANIFSIKSTSFKPPKQNECMIFDLDLDLDFTNNKEIVRNSDFISELIKLQNHKIKRSNRLIIRNGQTDFYTKGYYNCAQNCTNNEYKLVDIILCFDFHHIKFSILADICESSLLCDLHREGEGNIKIITSNSLYDYKYYLPFTLPPSIFKIKTAQNLNSLNSLVSLLNNDIIKLLLGEYSIILAKNYKLALEYFCREENRFIDRSLLNFMLEFIIGQNTIYNEYLRNFTNLNWQSYFSTINGSNNYHKEPNPLFRDFKKQDSQGNYKESAQILSFMLLFQKQGFNYNLELSDYGVCLMLYLAENRTFSFSVNCNYLGCIILEKFNYKIKYDIHVSYENDEDNYILVKTKKYTNGMKS